MWPYIALVFLSSFGIMTVELAAGRLMAPTYGTNLYIWTSVIGVVLAGMGLGAMAGGRLADWTAPRRLLPLTLLLAGLATAGVAPLLPWADGLPYRKLPMLLWTVAPVATVFFLPAFTLALTPPVVYKLAVRDLSRAGALVGQLAAANALGAVSGTFATGFWLVPSLGSRETVLAIGALMLVLAAVATPWARLRRAVAVALVAAVTVVVVQRQPAFLKGPCLKESAYFCLQIAWSRGDFNGRTVVVKQMVLDWLVHSGVSEEEPSYLWYDYEKIMAWITKARPGNPLHAFFIGGGGYVLPHWFEGNLPGVQVEVAEIDPAVTELAMAEFVPAATTIVTHQDDARRVLLRLPAAKRYQVVIGDAFNDVSVPFHLTTREFARLVRDRLADGGLYMANVVDFPEGEFQGAFARTLAQEFPYVYVLNRQDAVARPTRFTTLVVVASLTPIPWAEWQPQAPLAVNISTRGPNDPYLTLTDDHAPVDNLLLPLFAQRWGW